MTPPLPVNEPGGPGDRPAGGDTLRDRLLSQQAPRPAGPERLAAYRKEIQAMLDQNEKGLRREKRVVTVLWLYLVALATAFLIIGGLRPNTTLGVWFGVLACFWLLFGAVLLLKHFVNR